MSAKASFRFKTDAPETIPSPLFPPFPPQAAALPPLPAPPPSLAVSAAAGAPPPLQTKGPGDGALPGLRVALGPLGVALWDESAHKGGPAALPRPPPPPRLPHKAAGRAVKTPPVQEGKKFKFAPPPFPAPARSRRPFKSE